MSAPSFAKKEAGPSLNQLEVKITAKSTASTGEIEVRMDPEVCGTKRRPKSLLLGPQSELQEAVVWLEGPNLLGWPQQKMDEGHYSALMIQKDCEIEPHIAIVPPGGVLKVLNKDPILHSLRALGRKNYPSLRTQPPHLKAVFFKFEEPEIIPLYSDLHPWMKAFVVVAPHQSHAISNESGTAVIKKIPAGAYRLNLWHPILGSFTYPEIIEIPSRKKIEINWDAASTPSQQ